MPRTARAVLFSAAAVALLATLIFLFARTQAAGYKVEAYTLGLLRELRDVDARWDADATRLAEQLSGGRSTLPDRRPLMARLRHELQREAPGTRFAADLRAIDAGLEEKLLAYRVLESAHADSLARLERAQAALSALATEAATTRLRDPRSAERAAALAALADQVRAALATGSIELQDERERQLQPRLDSLLPAAAALDPRLAAAAREAADAVGAFLQDRRHEAFAWRKFAFLTVGARIDLAAQGLARSIEGALDDKDRWRVYLVAYAAALLLGIAYLASRVVKAQAQLRRANETLERRVDERTRDLAATLEQLKESEAQLVQSEKMSSLGQLVAGVAHEINTPLAYVKNSVSHVRDRLPELRAAMQDASTLLAMLQSDETDGDALQALHGALQARLGRLAEQQALEDLDALTRDGMHGIDQIAELVGNLRSFARLDRSKVASFNVNEGVRATLLIARPALRKVDIEKDLGDVPSITCSPSQVNQVLLNLVTNAAQAIEKPRGRVSVRTRREGPRAIAIEVSDDGRGIEADVLPRIFDPFFTTKEAGKGTGLGLSIAYKIVTQHGGRIDVASRPGEGSTFTVILPVEPPAALAAPAAAEACA